MKYGIITLLSLSIVLVSCREKEEPEGPKALEMPPLSCEGRMTLGCYMNDDLVVVNKHPLNAYASYGMKPGQNHGTLVMGIDFKTDKGRRHFSIKLFNMVFDTGYYALGYDDVEVGKNMSIFGYNDSTNHLYVCNAQMQGELHITGLDLNNQIVCGTFWFDAINVNDDQDTLKVRDGRFDLPFKQKM